MQILIGDPLSTYRRRLKNILSTRKLGPFLEVPDKTALLTTLKQESVLLIILSEEMGGPQLIRTIRKMDGYERCPVFFLSRQATHDRVLDAVEAGVTGYVLQPLDDQASARKIHRTVRQLRRAEDTGASETADMPYENRRIV